MTDAVTYRREDEIAFVTLNRADKRNRLDADIVAGAEAAWQAFMADEAARCAVLHADGAHFSVGADLNAIPHDLYRAIPSVGVTVDKPVVAAVNGWCVGGAMVMTTMCDLLVAADDAIFSYPEVKIGFSGGLISNLATRIPHKVAMELLLVGEPVSAARMYEVGYVNKLAPAAETVAAATEYARKIASGAPLSARMLKRFSAEALPKGPTEVAGIARSQVAVLNASDDLNEGLAAFKEKRAPRFAGH